MLISQHLEVFLCGAPGCGQKAFCFEFAGDTQEDDDYKTLFGLRLHAKLEHLKHFAQEDPNHVPHQVYMLLILDIPHQNYPDILIKTRMPANGATLHVAKKFAKILQPFVAASAAIDHSTTWQTLARAPTRLWITTRPGKPQCTNLLEAMVPEPSAFRQQSVVNSWKNLITAINNATYPLENVVTRPTTYDFMLKSGHHICCESETEPAFSYLSTITSSNHSA